jgi:hypothetical protein
VSMIGKNGSHSRVASHGYHRSDEHRSSDRGAEFGDSTTQRPPADVPNPSYEGHGVQQVNIWRSRARRFL